MKQSYLLIALLFCFSTVTGQTLTLKSIQLSGQATNKLTPNGSGFKGENKSPPLYWANQVKGSKSFAVSIFDKDATNGSGSRYWLPFDIPANIAERKPSVGNGKLNTVL